MTIKTAEAMLKQLAEYLSAFRKGIRLCAASSAGPSTGAALRAVVNSGSSLVAFASAIVIASSLLMNVASAQPSSTSVEQSQKVENFLQLLGDKDVQDWLEAQEQLQRSAENPPAKLEIGAALSSGLQDARQHLLDLASSVPLILAEVGQAASELRAATQGHGFFAILLLAGGFVLLGLCAEWLFRRAVRAPSATMRFATPVTPGDRAKLMGLRLLLGVGSVVAFGVGSFGSFLAFQWPDLLRTIVITLLVAALTFMIARGVFAILFGSSDASSDAASADHRLLPMSDDVARYWRSRFELAVGWFAFGDAFVLTLRALEVNLGVIQIFAYALGLGLLVIGLEAVWRRPVAQALEPDARTIPTNGTAARSWLYSVAFCALWLLWVVGAMRLFWLIAVAVALPLAIIWSRKAIRHLFRVEPASESETPESESEIPVEPAPGSVAPASDLMLVAIEGVLRALLILAAILLLAWGWGVAFQTLAAGESTAMTIVRHILGVLVILLVADLAWRLTKAFVDALLAKTDDPGDPGSVEGVRHAKMRTLLPIIRNVTMVFLATLAVLMVLSNLGVQIGPLIASAGVVGVAIGFGAQTVVKDIISGMFYLLDDAFRIGEYIVSGEFMGSVESFSLRSVRLRHHNGPVYTIPFGDLGAVQNLSRDFYIDKFKFTVTYDSDLDKAGKLIKQLGRELMQDPDVGPLIIEPMKLQRVDNFGEYGIVLKFKMMVRPGQFGTVRRKAFPLIKKVFEENGIKFAHPTVQVAEADQDSRLAAAQQALTIEASKQATG